MKRELINCFTWYVNRVAETVEYEAWSDEFCRDVNRRTHERFTDELRKYIDLSKLTREEAIELRFMRWDEESDLYLIPLYLLSFIPIGTKLTSIGGETVIYDGTNIDNDIRFGCIAYGINIPETKGEEK